MANRAENYIGTNILIFNVKKTESNQKSTNCGKSSKTWATRAKNWRFSKPVHVEKQILFIEILTEKDEYKIPKNYPVNKPLKRSFAWEYQSSGQPTHVMNNRKSVWAE